VGTALAMACNFFDIDLEVYMVKISYHQKPYRRVVMENYGSNVFASPSMNTSYGRKVLADDPDSQGSLGIAISEAVEAAATSGGTRNTGSDQCWDTCSCTRRSSGLKRSNRWRWAGSTPTSSSGARGRIQFRGFAFPFLHRNLTQGNRTRLIAVEPASCPSLTKGKYTFDYGDSAAMAPVVKMHTLGHTFMPPGIHAGGLRYHGMAPSVSALVHHGDIEARAVNQIETFEAAVAFSRAEG